MDRIVIALPSSIILPMDLSFIHSILRALWLMHAVLLLPSYATSPASRSSTSTTTILEGNRSAADRLALLSFKSMISNDPSQALASWNDSVPICHWQGVACGRRHPERVAALRLEALNLLGSISPSLANLTFLQRLHLPNNLLHGRIPPELGNLPRLRYLNFSGNSLEGGIPPALSRCPRLQELILGNNMLQGEIPSALSQCRELQILSLRRNFLTGSIPDELASLSKLTYLDLRGNNLTGSIPPSLENLSSLIDLDVNTNSLSGIIPSSLGQLSSLVFLLLQYNNLVGTIPSSLGKLSSLQYLDLSHNNLDGDISPSLGNLSSLLDLNLSYNNLTGSIPPSLGNLSSLTEMDLSINTLSGEIPPSLGLLPSVIALYLSGNALSGGIPPSFGSSSSLTLTAIGLSHNKLSGRIPSSFYNLSSLTILGVADNELIGTLPPDLGRSLPNLQSLLMYFNQFHGPIPASLANASGLQDIELTGNNFTGTIPTSLGALPELYWLSLDRNQLEAGDTHGWSFLTSLTNCSNLQVLQLDDNRLRGTLPSSIANLSTTLQWLVLGGNQISGSLPSDIGKFFNLTLLDLGRSHLTGSIPDSVGELRSLQRLYLSNNKLSGPIPTSIGNLTQLSELDLVVNSLTGSIPATLGNCQALVYLDLSYNKLTGGIPKEVVSLSSLSQYLGLSHNSLVGALPSEIGSLTNLRGLQLFENNLTGEIPSSIGECQVLEFLYMNGNHFQGIIPQSMSNLKGIQELDLSSNNLSGGVPRFLEDFRFLQHLNLSFNNFEGEVPTKGVFRNLSAFSVVGNDDLCGGDPKLGLKKCSPRTNKRRNRSAPIKAIIPVAAALLFLLLIICLLIIRYRLYKSRKQVPSAALVEEQLIRVSYSDLLKATDGFSSANLIGAGGYGSVYKGIMELAEERIVAVKVLNLLQRGASRSFMAECNALRSIRHRNLVKVITSCSSVDYKGDDFKALVFEFMPNGSLENWLHPQASDQSRETNLSLIQRLNIAVDVASALDYLHHHGPAPIVHCDLKPSNVLLDEDMTAHVGDFGLARFLTKTVSKASQNPSSSIGVKGTIGYVAPEYGVANQVSTEGDVYSYGILLLEMFTGRRPTEETLKEGTGLCKSVEMAFPERVIDIIDPCLLSEEKDGGVRRRTREFLVSMLRIGLLCSKESPKERMQMEDVIKELLKARDALTGGERRNRNRPKGEGPSTVDDDEWV
ncbi:probable LRR receptor-like serine/threonine-protein kinase At3g47570 [Phoenix dactylifera]|uniref:Receptor kinase-like protein Xa21 n=1 Tax=Phoenix dactylifera TaxID=42345 RepID=A0A8B9AHA3_PHODC|nr:probable LRR receptor-like serine/threonine-protein kinase At3g47570 [Phoenix dactylifera]